MGVNTNNVIAFMEGLKNIGITYSMNGSRDGSDGTGDCSGTIVRAIEQSGGTKASWLFNTDSMHAYLIQNGYKLVYENNPTYTPKRGDIFIWGRKGQSGGAFGHTGIFYDDNENIIHCNFGYNGVTINNVDSIAKANGFPYYYIYRLEGGSTTPINPTPPTPNKPQASGRKRFGYLVNDLQFVNGIWQIRCDHLCPIDFTWVENGIDVAHVDVMDGNGNVSNNQTVKIGDYVSFIPSAVVSCSKTTNYKGVQLSEFTFKPNTGAIWLARTSIDKLLYI